MRFLAVMAAGLLLFSVPRAMAAEAAAPTHAAQPGPLKPGKSAGVTVAQQTRSTWVLVGAGAIIAIVAVTSTASNGSSQPNMQSVTVTTP
jgi:hypothetical protein